MRQPKRPPVFRPDGTIELQLTKGHVAVIDAADADLARHDWYAVQKKPGCAFYAARHIPGHGRSMLHRELLGLTDPKIKGDHKNGDTLDCRRDNLRPASDTVSNRNISLANARNTSGYPGVSRHGRGWRACIGKMKFGTFATPQEAYAERLRQERLLWGVQPRRAAAHALSFDPDPPGYG